MRKKILFLIPTLGHGGAEKVLVNLVNNLDQEKYDITVKTLFDTGEHKGELKPHVRYQSVWHFKPFHGNNTLLSLIPAKWLARKIIDEPYDVVVSYLEGPTSRIVGGYHGNARKVYWIHSVMKGDKRFKVGFRTKNEALTTYQQADKIVFVSKGVRESFEESAGCSFEHGAIYYNTNETEHIAKLARETVTDVTFDKTVINVCSVGKIIAVKGYDRLVNVHKRLMEEGIAHHIYLLGVGDEQKILSERLQQAGLTDSFTFLGYRDNPYKYVAACDLFVCSSYREGFSTAVTEALIVGTPVVSTDCSGAHELLGEHNDYGIVTENSEEGIYKGMREMLCNPDKRQAYASAALERGKMFSRTATIEAVEQMFDGLVKNQA